MSSIENRISALVSCATTREQSRSSDNRSNTSDLNHGDTETRSPVGAKGNRSALFDSTLGLESSPERSINPPAALGWLLFRFSSPCLATWKVTGSVVIHSAASSVQ